MPTIAKHLGCITRSNSHRNPVSPREYTTWKHSGSLFALLIVGLQLLLSGCGFQLRDKAELPIALARTHIAGLSPYDDLAVELSRTLRANGVRIVDADQATAILRINDTRRGRRVLSVGADGKVRELELYATVNFDVKGGGNALELKNQSLTQTRDFFFSETDVYGKASEAKLLYEDMENELVRLMLYRLEAAGHRLGAENG
jgi:LPS-assembly lipoprotein